MKVATFVQGEESDVFTDKYRQYVEARKEINLKEEEASKHDKVVESLQQLLTWMSLNGNDNSVIEKMQRQIAESQTSNSS